MKTLESIALIASLTAGAAGLSNLACASDKTTFRLQTESGENIVLVKDESETEKNRRRAVGLEACFDTVKRLVELKKYESAKERIPTIFRDYKELPKKSISTEWKNIAIVVYLETIKNTKEEYSRINDLEELWSYKIEKCNDAWLVAAMLAGEHPNQNKRKYFEKEALKLNKKKAQEYLKQNPDIY